MGSSQELALNQDATQSANILTAFENGLAVVLAPAELRENRAVLDFMSSMHVSSRTKPKPGWQSQDRAAISFLKKPILPDTLKQAFAQVPEKTDDLDGGCSCTSLAILPEQILVAWMGDSPAFLVGIDAKTGKIEEIMGLNEPHIPTYDKETLLAKGGIIDSDGRLDQKQSLTDQANCYSLSMSRAFGNKWLGNLLIRTPDVIVFERKDLSDKLVWYAVIGSDGVLMESERNLMFPRKKNAKFNENDLITYCAELFKNLVNAQCSPWLPENGNWAENITMVSQQLLKQMEDVADKSQVGYAAMDDTTLLIVPLPKADDFPAILMTVADGHREAGEVTAQRTVDIIHQYLTD